MAHFPGRISDASHFRPHGQIVFERNPHSVLRELLVAIITASALWIGYVALWGDRASSANDRPAAEIAAMEEIKLSPTFTGPGADLVETTARPLFHPSRRPLAGSTQGDGRSGDLPRGRYELTGVSISPERRVAMLRDVATRKTIHVEQAKDLNGILVEAISENKVVLKLGGEREELLLKIAATPRAAGEAPPNPDARPAHAQPAPGGTTQRFAPPAPPHVSPLVPPPAAAVPSGAPQSAIDVANADPITEADVAEREARVRARRARRESAAEGAPK